MSRVLWVSISPGPSQPRGRFPVACSIVFRTARIVSRSCSGARPASVFELVAPCPHELPAALLHFLDGLRKNVADLRVQSDGRLDACCVEHIRDTPQADAYPVFAPGIVEDVRNVIRGIGADADAEGGVVLPDLHIRREPDRKRVVARPLEGLALGDERVVVALRAADRPRRGLRLGGHSQ